MLCHESLGDDPPCPPQVPAALIEPNLRELISREKIAARNAELGRQIAQDYAGKEPDGHYRPYGSFVFAADLNARDLAQRELGQTTSALSVEFLALQSYGDQTMTSGVVQITADLTHPIEGKHVLIVEDIVDTGLTMSYLLENLKTRRPASVKLCSLLHKPARTQQQVPIDYLG